MNQDANPIEFLIDFAWANGANRFVVNNAKDELNKLRSKIDSFIVLGWARINNDGYPYDLRLYHNPYVDQNTVMPIYYDKSSYELWKNGYKSK